MFSKPAYLTRFFSLAFILCLPPFPSLAAAPPLELWIHPYLHAPELMRRFTPLAQYLERKTGRKIEVKISPTYENHKERIGQGRADLAFIGPFGYAQITEKHGAQAVNILASLEGNGKAKFHGVIVTRSGTAIKNLQDLAGRSFAFGDKNSTMGFLVPRSILGEAGIDLARLGRHSFLSSHNDVALAVLGGYYEAGALQEEVFKEYADRGLRVLAKSPAIPEHLFLASKKMPAPLAASLRQALFELKDPGILGKIQKTATGIVPASDKDYEVVRGLCQKHCKSGPDSRK